MNKTCKSCGRLLPDNVTSCPVCGQASKKLSTPKQENVITGIVGALLGAAIGGAVILLLSRLGFIASVSGLILAVCTLKGYELLGRRISARGAFICFILIIATPYFADRLDWAFIVKDAYADMGITLGDAFAAIPDLLSEGIIPKADYIKNLGLLYLFALVGAFSTLREYF